MASKLSWSLYMALQSIMSATCKLLKLCLDFSNNYYEALELKNEVTWVESNFITTVLDKRDLLKTHNCIYMHAYGMI